MKTIHGLFFVFQSAGVGFGLALHSVFLTVWCALFAAFSLFMFALSE